MCLQPACRSLPVPNPASCMAVTLAACPALPLALALVQIHDSQVFHWGHEGCSTVEAGNNSSTTATLVPYQGLFPPLPRTTFCHLCCHAALRELVSFLAQASELLPCDAPCCPAGPELSAEDRTDLVLAMVEALIAQGQPHRAEVALQRLQGPGANHSRADSPEVLLRRADMVLKLGHEVRSQHSGCS